MTTSRLALAAALLALGAPRAEAFHRTTPAAVAITTTGDNFLPRLPALGDRLAFDLTLGSPQIVRYDRHAGVLETLTSEGDSANPAISSGGSIVAWDADCNLLGCDPGGRQIFQRSGPTLFQVTFDPSGTSTNPALSGRGTRLAFESEGDLANTGNSGARQIFTMLKGGAIEQVSRGNGNSGNPAFSKSGRILAFDSTSHPVSGADTGISQIWLLQRTGEMMVLTDGAGPSRRPVLAANGKLLAFESRADLAGNGADTNKWQIFAYDLTNGTRYQVTDDPVGCTGVSVDDISGDFRLGYACNGQGYLHQVRANERFRLPIDGGDTAQAVVELGVHFMVVSTTADLVNGGTHAGHRIYLMNLFQNPAIAVTSDQQPF